MNATARITIVPTILNRMSVKLFMMSVKFFMISFFVRIIFFRYLKCKTFLNQATIVKVMGIEPIINKYNNIGWYF